MYNPDHCFAWISLYLDYSTYADGSVDFEYMDDEWMIREGFQNSFDFFYDCITHNQAYITRKRAKQYYESLIEFFLAFMESDYLQIYLNAPKISSSFNLL